MLNITFTKTAGDPDAYAFINGIEVVSMPNYLYYTSSLEGGFQFIGQKNSFSIETDFAMENVYRLNVGGNSVSPMNDTGMFRTWDADDKYCPKPGFVPANTRVDLKFTQIPNYTAPVEVYQTARTMGNNKTENMGYNLTWFCLWTLVSIICLDYISVSSNQRSSSRTTGLSRFSYLTRRRRIMQM